jgi:asparagine synthase (glutamine-hydrolysing)
MFAFAIWDRSCQELFLARDRYGIKPLYYTLQAHTFLFGSEVKAILAHPAYQATLDKEALLEYFTFQNFFTDRTLFAGVKLLPAGTYMRISLGMQKIDELQRYWDYHFAEPENPKDEREYLEELDRLFRQAVQRQLVSDVDVGAYLSGGMDSGSITAIAATQLPYLKTFTCGFDLHSASGLELAFDEREKAEFMSYLFKTEHYEMVLKAGDMERILPRLAWHLEEPRVGQSYPNFYAAQLASKFVKVVLSGGGGDELFGGYPWRYYRAVVNDSFEDYIDKYYVYWQRLIPNKVIRQVFKPIWPEVGHVWTRDIFRDVFTKHAPELTQPEDYINHSLYFEAKTFLHGLLVVEDKLSMAHSLETRVPFLDNDLVDFAMQMPVCLKLGNLGEVVRLNENEPGPKTAKYFRKTKDGKLLLRKAMTRYIPAEVTQREKQGFSAPDASWFKGESIDYVRRRLSNGHARIYEFLDREAVQSLVNEHLEGKQNRRLLVWSLLNMEQWCERFL